MRVLVLSYETPAYPSGGGPSRQHSLLEPLADRHQIRVLSTGGTPRLGRLPAGVDVRFVDSGRPLGHPAERWMAKHLNHYRGTDPWIDRPAAHHRRALAAALPGELEAFTPDVVVVEHGELGPLVHRVPAPVGSVLVLHNILLSVQAQKIRGAGIVGGANGVLELAVIARRERADLGRATQVVVVTERDAGLARRLNRSAEVTVVPNCVDTGYFRRRGPRAERPTVVMTASYQYPPNQWALTELVDDVFPAVRLRVPDAELVLVGQQMPAALRAHAEAQPGVRVAGEVDDIRPELERAWVSVAPLRKGSGSPLKVIEALAAGVPVVGTSRVAAALGLRVGLDGVLTGDSPADLAVAIGTVLDDPSARDRLAAAGERVARGRFDRAGASDFPRRRVDGRGERPPIPAELTVRIGADGSYLRWQRDGMSRLPRRAAADGRGPPHPRRRPGRVLQQPGPPEAVRADDRERAIRFPKATPWNQLRVPVALREDRCDVYLGGANVVPVRAPAPTVVVLHDCKPFRVPELVDPRWRITCASGSAGRCVRRRR